MLAKRAQKHIYIHKQMKISHSRDFILNVVIGIYRGQFTKHKLTKASMKSRK